MKITLLGAGNVASHLGPALYAAGHSIIQVFSRKAEHAEALAAITGARASTDFKAIEPGADVYLFMLGDDALLDLGDKVSFPGAICIHTSGSVPIEVFKNHSSGSAVLYPLQTFSRKVNLDLSEVPFFLEADSQKAFEITNHLARGLTSKIYEVSSETRTQLHLAAVFASNFSNHLYCIASKLLEEQRIPFSVLQPLIKETTEKAFRMSPCIAQTGPAIRGDKKIIRAHLDTLRATQSAEEMNAVIYELLSKSIMMQKE